MTMWRKWGFAAMLALLLGLAAGSASAGYYSNSGHYDKYYERIGTYQPSGTCEWCGTAYEDGYYAEEVCWAVCPRCGNEDGGSHRSTCQATGICVNCGYESEDISVTHDYVYTSEGDRYHRETCALCDYSIRNNHYVSCTDNAEKKGSCLYCGEETTLSDAGMWYVEHGEKKLAHDEQKHYFYCVLCNAEQGSYDHTGCANSGGCIVCGETNIACDFSYEIGYGTEYHYNDTHHYAICKFCGTKGWEGPHYGICTNPVVCMECGAENVSTSDFVHTGLTYESVSDTQHRECCSSCGWEDERPHSGYDCANPVCLECEAENVSTSDFVHTGLTYESMSDTEHRQYCSSCGWESEASYEHSSTCVEPERCATCQAEDVTIIRVFHGETNWIDLGTQCQGQCSSCGTVIFEAMDHYTSCFEPGICRSCGAKGDDFKVSHTYQTVNLGEQHQYQCLYCDYKEEEDHRANCDSPNRCRFCYATITVSEDKLIHHLPTNPQYIISGDTHTFVCNRCANPVTDLHDYTADGSCNRCGYTPSSRVPADADENDAVDLNDALRILQYATGAETAINTVNGDVNADGLCDVQDALLIMQHEAGWGTTLE